MGSLLYSLWHNSQEPRCGNNLNMHWRIKRLKNIRYIHTTEYHLPLKKKEIMHYATTRWTLRDIMLNKIRQSQKDKYCMTLLTWGKGRKIKRGHKLQGDLYSEVRNRIKFIRKESTLLILTHLNSCTKGTNSESHFPGPNPGAVTWCDLFLPQFSQLQSADYNSICLTGFLWWQN